VGLGDVSLAPELAILDPASPGGAARVLWHDPGAQRASHRIPEVRDFSYHQLSGQGHGGSSPLDLSGAAARVRRPIARSVRRVESLKTFFGTKRLHLGDGALCEVPDPPSTNVSVFAPLCFGSRTYHVLAQGADALPSSVSDFAAVRLVTGCCLFSDQAVHATAAFGESFRYLAASAGRICAPLRRIEASPRLTLYELESACRLPWLTGDMVALLPSDMPVSVTIDVPRIQYYLYLLDAFSRGFIAPRLMERWFALVDERSRLVSELLRRQLSAALAEARSGRLVPVRRAESMACLEAPIRRGVRAREAIAVDEMAKILSAHDQIWGLTLSVAWPTAYRDLINLSYAVEHLRAAIAGEGERPRLGIAVDNPAEWPACTHARAIFADISATRGGLAASLLGLYPLERAFTGQSTGRTDLYYNDPGQQFLDHAGRRYDVAQLLSRLYPDLPLVTTPEGHRRRYTVEVHGKADPSTVPPRVATAPDCPPGRG
jgi:hypothetical protein